MVGPSTPQPPNLTCLRKLQLSQPRPVKDWGDKVISWNKTHPHHTNSKLYDRVRNEQFSENKSWESIIVDPKTAFKTYPNPKNSPLGPQKAKNDPKIRPTKM